MEELAFRDGREKHAALQSQRTARSLQVPGNTEKQTGFSYSSLSLRVPVFEIKPQAVSVPQDSKLFMS